MAAPTNTGMDRADLKRLLLKSKQEPVNCAIAQPKEPGPGLLLLHRTKQPRALCQDLEKQFPDAKNPRWGTAHVDLDDDPKLVKFIINKPVSGMAWRLVKTLKGIGFTKVVILLEDSTPVEADAEDDDAPADSSPADPGLANSGLAAAAAPPPPPDATGLAAALRALAQRIGAAAGEDAARRADLLRLAQAAQASLKAGDLAAAAAGIDALRAAIDEAAAAATGAGAYAKSRLAWIATRRKMAGDIELLRAAIVSEYQQDGVAAQLDAAYRDRVAPLLERLDDGLADQLDAAGNATDPVERARLVAEARASIERYQSVLASEPLIADLDDNPFVPLAIQKTLAATLAALAATVR